MPKITQQQKEAVRSDILKAARSVFIEKGYEAASMKDIVARSGRSFGGVYLYYSNKEDVFLDLLRRQFEDMAENFAPDKPMSAWEAFERFLGEQEKRAREAVGGLAPCMFEYLIVGRRDANRRSLIEERHRAVYGSMFALVQDGLRRGEFQPSKSVETFVHWLVSFLDGIFLESIMTGAERIELAGQFELLLSVCRSILMPLGKEESK
ncbi:TetR family transcriptional regulator [Cohnella terricola]|uniref:TetR/AcrR family transcriptional regulator n=1 Tax=Cohnella terricola TaxID=1289167 RepID=A0A559JIU0_9BACL|nr:TetR family transcriptional regulator [Cohnella terricola]TVX99794.1 TetR/AcrR family transcriptional regulator [Cohnella terricola]